ncbi:hypothetical protein [Brasilonema sp. UFV-L1]
MQDSKLSPSGFHPVKACSLEAIGCLDFEPKTDCCNAYQKRHNKAV